jgi:hypothetical protein
LLLLLPLLLLRLVGLRPSPAASPAGAVGFLLIAAAAYDNSAPCLVAKQHDVHCATAAQ